MSLPIDTLLPRLRQKLAAEPILILEAPPGAGKTTAVPPALLDEGWLAGRKILMLEPRRLAARSAAEYMARQRGERVGETIGYRIRYEQQVSARTRIEIITEGILTRRLQSDPELEGVGLVIFDEFHERNIHSDLALALCLDLRRGLREDLRLLVMSASLDSQALQRLLGAESLRAEGRSWPVETHYLGGEIDADCGEAMRRAILRAERETATDILAFLPGMGEIERLARRLREEAPQLQICPLHGRLDKREQLLALEKSARRKLVLATNIAETSLTIDGIGTVVDSGLCRQPVFDPASGISRLKTTRISQASSLQRAGRAGRQGPGQCYRLWSEGVQASLLPQTPPEIRHADLAPLALDLIAWGLPDADRLQWLDPPPVGALAGARDLLLQLGLIDRKLRITPAGRQAVALPLHPRFASMVLNAQARQRLPLGCLLAVCLGDEGMSAQSDEDLLETLRIAVGELQRGAGGRSSLQLAFTQLVKRFDCRQPQLSEIRSELIAPLLATAYPERIAYSAPGRQDFLLSSGRRASLPAGSLLQKETWLIATDIRASAQQIQIRCALPLEREWVEQTDKSLPWQTEVGWDDAQQRVVSHRVKQLGAIRFRSEHQPAEEAETVAALCEAIRGDGGRLLDWSPAALQFMARTSLLHQTLGAPWPLLERERLVRNPEDWLAPYLGGITRAAQLQKLDLLPALQALLGWNLQQDLERLAPARIQVPSGEQVRIDYLADSPTLSVKLQQLFGLAESPRICRELVPLKVELLSPAGRPLAVTSDLRNFWDQVYPEVLKEMRGRYPKHPWPDDPWQAKATAKTKKRA